MKNQTLVVNQPLVIMFEQDGKTITHIHQSEDCPTHEHFGILIADLVRHVANAFDVHENSVWEWVDKERFRPTDSIEKVSE